LKFTNPGNSILRTEEDLPKTTSISTKSTRINKDITEPTMQRTEEEPTITNRCQAIPDKSKETTETTEEIEEVVVDDGDGNVSSYLFML
jgi:hypothetical protein